MTTDTPVKRFVTYSQIIPFTAKEMTYGDITGAFPYTSSRGAKYISVMYDFDGNVIITHTLKSRQAHEIAKYWKTLHDNITHHGHKIKTFILDNEFPNELKKTLQNKAI